MTAVEICVDDVDGARTAEACGADRIELCADLLEGGITPSIGMVTAVLDAVTRVGVQVLIRPRGGDFVYDRDEVAVMRADIAAMLALPRTTDLGFVLSGLTRDGRVERSVIAELVDACGGAPTTLSRAFDEIEDQFRALDTLAELGVDRVLTAGGPGAAADGHEQLAALVTHSAGRVGVLAGGGVRSANVSALVTATGVDQVHLRAPEERDGRTRTSAAQVRAVAAALGRRA